MRIFASLVVIFAVHAWIPYANCYTIGELERFALRAHNEHRSKHSAPSLELDPELCAHALRCAKVYVEKKAIDMSCPNVEAYGQNLMAGYGGYTEMELMKVAVSSWYSGEKSYDYSAAKFSSEAGAFTQMVWKSSRLLGAACKLDSDIAVCVALYSPRGNVGGQFTDNVSKQ